MRAKAGCWRRYAISPELKRTVSRNSRACSKPAATRKFRLGGKLRTKSSKVARASKCVSRYPAAMVNSYKSASRPEGAGVVGIVFPNHYATDRCGRAPKQDHPGEMPTQ